MPQRKNLELRKKLLELANKGLSQSNIAKELSVSPTAILKNFRRLEKDGLVNIIHGKPTFYKLTENGKLTLSSLPVKDKPFLDKTISLHDFKVLIPILEHGKLTLDKKEVQINNWTKEYYNIDLPTKVTLEITTKSAILHFHETQIPRSLGATRAITEFAMKGMVAISSLLGSRGFKLDIMNARVISQHFATKTAKEIDEQVAKGTVFKVNMDRQASSISGNLKQEASAWVDRSEGKLEVETNDLTYEEQLIKMPIWVKEMRATITELNLKLDTIGMALNTTIKKPKEESVSIPLSNNDGAYR